MCVVVGALGRVQFLGNGILFGCRWRLAGPASHSLQACLTPGAAALCIDKMNGRFFGGKKILCGYWDGVEEFKEKEDEVDAVKREEEFGKWLDSHK